MAYVYILINNQLNKTYTGSTTDLVRRLREHNSGKHYFTKRFLPWKIFYHEELPSLADARQKEKYLKTAAGRRFIKKLFNNIPG